MNPIMEYLLCTLNLRVFVNYSVTTAVESIQARVFQIEQVNSFYR